MCQPKLQLITGICTMLIKNANVLFFSTVGKGKNDFCILG